MIRRTTAPAPAPRRRRLALVGATLATATLLAACGEGSDSAEPSAAQTAPDGSTFNQADIDFATRMIPHHAQAVQMVVMAQGRDLDPEVAALMDQIRTAQVPEIEQMSDLLRAWDQPIPETSLDHANAHSPMEDMDHMSGMSGMPGMMSADAMGELDASDDRGFETMWLSMMVEHHEGAIEMAEEELETGANEEALALADDIVESQTAEIVTLEELAG